MKGLMHETGGEPKDIGSYICFELGLLVHGHRWDKDNTFYLYYFVVVSWYLSRLLTSVCIVVSWLVGNKWVFACCYFCCDMFSSRSDSRGDIWVWRYLVFAWWSGLRVRAYFGPWISGIDFRMHINVWSAYVLGVMVLLEKWQQFEELIIGSHVEYWKYFLRSPQYRWHDFELHPTLIRDVRLAKKHYANAPKQARPRAYAKEETISDEKRIIKVSSDEKMVKTFSSNHGGRRKKI
ncbi:hypothetical protein YC2023_039283 [Brassica napus]